MGTWREWRWRPRGKRWRGELLSEKGALLLESTVHHSCDSLPLFLGQLNARGDEVTCDVFHRGETVGLHGAVEDLDRVGSCPEGRGWFCLGSVLTELVHEGVECGSELGQRSRSCLPLLM